MLCSQREVQTSGILTHIERDECLRNSRSVYPLYDTTDLDFCSKAVDNVHRGRSTGLGIIWARCFPSVALVLCILGQVILLLWAAAMPSPNGGHLGSRKMLCASVLSNAKYYPDKELLLLSKQYLKVLEMEVYIFYSTSQNRNYSTSSLRGGCPLFASRSHLQG